MGDKVPEDTKGEVESAMGELKTALEGDDIDEIKTKTEALQNAAYKLAEIAYKDAQAEAGAADGSAEPAEGAADVEEGDFEVVDDDE